MESPRKFNDCYFYYYSTCTKGDNCVFRHEPSALGCETMCTAWQQGKCLDKRCKLRHMELRKNRKQIPCYWENQPGGCRKIHCPFMHKNPDARTDGIAPSQPGPPQPLYPNIHHHSPSTPYCPTAGSEPPFTMRGAKADQVQVGVGVGVGVAPEVESPAMGVTPAVPAPQPVPLLWQQQRQAVVLDSAILGVLPGSSELLSRRVLAHEAAGPYAPHAPLPVDPLVVNFEEESDNESAPSSTPTKTASPDDPLKAANSKSQELLLLEKIQAEAAAYYSYDALPPADPPKERKLVRTNLNAKYERVSLDDLAGKKQPDERRNSLDFKVLSLEEIRARKKSDTIIHSKPITLNLSRKRKLSTQETITTSGNKIIKVVRSNSIVYKKLDRNAPAASGQTKADQKPNENATDRKRTISEQSDIYEIQEDELVDNCFEFKRIKIMEQSSNKPRLIRNRLSSLRSGDDEPKYEETDCNKADNDSDSEVQIVSVEAKERIDLSDNEVIDVETTRLGEPIDVVDLSDDLEESDITVSDLDLDLSKNVPDVVASCHKQSKVDNSEINIINDIDSLLDDDTL